MTPSWSHCQMNHGTFYAAPIPVYGKLPAPNYLITTSDSGQSWHVLSVTLPLIQRPLLHTRDSGLSLADFISPQVGWLAVYYAPSRAGLPLSRFYKTVDGGKTWTAIAYHVNK